ncbi:Uncharacterised protein [Mycobacteroides abscessus subsp. abscessus]|nr:Uncharacterised protein [Mycobacteroides abscessus subsp. abscessus]
MKTWDSPTSAKSTQLGSLTRTAVDGALSVREACNSIPTILLSDAGSCRTLSMTSGPIACASGAKANATAEAAARSTRTP